MQSKVAIEKILKHIKTVPLFHGFEENEVKELLSIAECHTTESGDYLIIEKQASDRAYLIMTGFVDIEIQTPDNDSATVAQLGPGSIIGELSLLGVKRRSASAIAREQVIWLSWDKEPLLEYLEKDYKLAYHFMKNLCITISSRLQNTNKELGNAIYQALYSFSS